MAKQYFGTLVNKYLFLFCIFYCSCKLGNNQDVKKTNIEKKSSIKNAKMEDISRTTRYDSVASTIEFYKSSNNIELCCTGLDTTPAIHKYFFALCENPKTEAKLLSADDSVISRTDLTSQSYIETRVNDSLYYLVFCNSKYNARKVLLSALKMHRNSTYGSYVGNLQQSFVWGWGTSTSNKNWVLFNVFNGNFIASGGNYMGKCDDKGVLFFLYNNCLLYYSEKTESASMILNFDSLKRSFSYSSYNWNFNCGKGQNYWEIIYQGDFIDTIRYFPDSTALPAR